MSGIGSHTKPNRGFTDDWLTPPEIIKACGEFDLDPCTPIEMPWVTAKNRFTVKDNGLSKDWTGRVWLNPPYGAQVGLWMQRLAIHGNGIALVFARTETAWFQDFVFPYADALLFIAPRLHFYTEKGERAKGNAGGPSVLVAYGSGNDFQLERSGIGGKFVSLNRCSAASNRVTDGAEDPVR